MATAPSQTRIVNKALALLGSVQRITHIGDGSAAAKTAAAIWDDARDETLVDHPWNFAIRRADLPASAEPPVFEYAFAYELPTDCLRWLPAPASGWHGFVGEQEGNLILSNAAAPIRIRYIARIEDLLTWSQGFIATMSWKLAAEMCEAITAGAVPMNRMMQGYELALARAKRQDGQASGGRGGRLEARSDWLDARNGWSSR